MGTIEVFDHTADVGLRIRGDDPADLFRTAAEGLFDYVVANRAAVRVERRGHRPPRRFDRRPAGGLAQRADLPLRDRAPALHAVRRPDRRRRPSLEATIGGEPIDRDRHILDHEVKAVTHHGASLERDGEGWVAEVILDI